MIPYLPLSDEVLLGVVRLQLGRLEQRVRDTHGAVLHVAEGVEDFMSPPVPAAAPPVRARWSS